MDRMGTGHPYCTRDRKALFFSFFFLTYMYSLAHCHDKYCTSKFGTVHVTSINKESTATPQLKLRRNFVLHYLTYKGLQICSLYIGVKVSVMLQGKKRRDESLSY